MFNSEVKVVKPISNVLNKLNKSTTEKTLEKQDKAAEDKTVGGIFSRAWYIGLAEPGKRTVKHNNKRNTTVKYETHSTLSCVMCGEGQ